MTGKNVIDRVRLFTNDTEPGDAERVSDVQMVLFINDGIRLIWDVRSDSRLAADGTRIVIAEIAAGTDTICLLDRFRGALANYTAAQVFLMNSGSGENIQRATTHMAQMTTMLMPQQN